MEFFELLEDLETASPEPTQEEATRIDTPVKDRVFKTVILTCLLLLIGTQILVSTRLYDVFRTLEGRFPPFPVVKPVRTEAQFSIPKLVKIDQNIDLWIQELESILATQQAATVHEENIKTEIPSTPTPRKTKPRKINQVVVVEEVNN